jgi:hypothetical protein
MAWVRAKKAKEERTGRHVEISHERRPGRGLHGIRSPELRRRDTSPVMIQRRDTAQGRAMIKAHADNLLPMSPPMSSPILSPPLFPTSSSPINVRRSVAGAPILSYAGSGKIDLSSSKVVFDMASSEKLDRLIQVQRIREKHEEKRRRHGDLQKEDEERGLWNLFWDVLEDVEAENRLEAEDEEEAGQLVQRLSSGLLDEVLNDRCGEQGMQLTTSGAMQLTQLQDRFKHYREEALEAERRHMEQLGYTSPGVGSGCFEDNEFFRHLLQVRQRSATPTAATPPILFSL